MGIAAGGGGKGPKSDINVTPLVDVVLVLLIIFIVTMPVLLRHITVEVPRKLESDEVVVSSSTQIVVTGKVDGSVEIDDGSGKTSVNRVDLAKSLGPLLDKIKSEKVVFVDFEDAMAYEEVVSIMDTVKSFEKRDGKSVLEQVKVALKIREIGAPPAAP